MDAAQTQTFNHHTPFSFRIIVTDHNWGGNTAVNRYLPWKEWVGQFAEGYEDAKRAGDEVGLDVFFGYEAGYRGTEFLIYGVDKEFMLAPSIFCPSFVNQNSPFVRR